MKKYIVAANWKMNKDVQSSADFAVILSKNLLKLKRTDVILCPPFTSLFHISEMLKITSLKLGGQNMYFEKSGAFTGEISGSMLKSAGCQYVILGHSERRHIFNESDELIQKKMTAALEIGLKPILCLGEKLEERQAGATHNVLERQFKGAFSAVSDDQLKSCVIAYEPVWAIGTGIVATPEQASEAHQFIRQLLKNQYGSENAGTMTILYGGSVKPSNAKTLIEAKDIDGFLVGGASLVEQDFVGISEIVERYLVEKEK
ncbi:MAG: triose-phosphate isomerase [Candidatus Marinimicrobia bacterium CG08_land_8_20_14_0_20_45_22]|nr:MAG: triose-phosphate isomerase [Candidatus Marinimicrobia bacterium CG08_land_8_20_14_0_20_45_22]